MQHESPAQPETTPAVVTAASPPAVEDEIDLFCPACGYDLRGLEAASCPECGTAIDLAKLRESSIPWVLAEGFRERFKGFWQTCSRVMSNPARFSREVARPVSLKEAQRFRWNVVGVAWLTLLVMAGLDLLLLFILEGWSMGDEWEMFFHDTGLSQPGFLVLGPVLVLLFLAGLTGLHLLFLHPKSLTVERQNRAVALGHYACAPLALLPILLVLRLAVVTFAWYAEVADADWAGALWMVLWFFSWLVIPSLGVFFLVSVLTIVGRAAQRGLAAQATLMLGLPLLWLGWGLFVFGALPAGVLFVYLFFLTG